MTGFELQTSSFASDRSTNWATITSQLVELNLLMWGFVAPTDWSQAS